MTYRGAPDLVPCEVWGDGFITTRCRSCGDHGPTRTDTDAGRRRARADHLDHQCHDQEGTDTP